MKKLILSAIALVLCISVKAQIEAPVKWSYAAKRLSNTEAVVFLRATIQDGWHIYSVSIVPPNGGSARKYRYFLECNDFKGFFQALREDFMSLSLAVRHPAFNRI